MTPQKISTESSYPQKILIFLKTPKYIEIHNFEPKKGPSLRSMKISEYLPHPPTPRIFPHGGRDTEHWQPHGSKNTQTHWRKTISLRFLSKVIVAKLEISPR